MAVLDDMAAVPDKDTVWGKIGQSVPAFRTGQEVSGTVMPGVPDGPGPQIE